MIKQETIPLNKITRNLYFFKSSGSIANNMNAVMATKHDLKSVVTLVAKVDMEKKSIIGSEFNNTEGFNIV